MIEEPHYIGGYTEHQANNKIDFLYYIDGVNKLWQYLKDQDFIKDQIDVSSTQIIEICGYIKPDSKLLEKTENGRNVCRDLKQRFGDYKFAIISKSSEDQEINRDYCIPDYEVIQPWLFLRKVVLNTDYGESNLINSRFKIFYRESELPENYGEEFWKALHTL